jgi:hypothetical protein
MRESSPADAYEPAFANTVHSSFTTVVAMDRVSREPDGPKVNGTPPDKAVGRHYVAAHF